MAKKKENAGSEEELQDLEESKKVSKTAKPAIDKEDWHPKTSLGTKVKSGEIDSIDYILENRLRILEPEIVDILIPNLSVDLLLVGQSKGKFGGGFLGKRKRRPRKGISLNSELSQ